MNTVSRSSTELISTNMQDPRKGLHPDWNTSIFNYGRNEIRSFLISSGFSGWTNITSTACAWTRLLLCFTWIIPETKGNGFPTNMAEEKTWRQSISFAASIRKPTVLIQTLRLLQRNQRPGQWPPNRLMSGGLGFGFKWDMGWMHDTLKYFSHDPIHRKYHHNEITFRSLYTFSENFVMPLSHDEVVHGKGSLLGKMPGDDWQKFANLRLLLGYMYATARQEIALHGRRNRSMERMESQQQPGLASAGV